jgi:hypothetical protein
MSVNAALTPSCSPLEIDCARALFFDKVITLGQGTHQNALNVVQSAPAHNGPVGPVPASSVASDPYTGFIPPFTEIYHYMGSFTTPPCTSGVVWLLHPTPVSVFESSVTFYRELINGLAGNQLATAAKPNFLTANHGIQWDVNLGNNNRRIQDMGERQFFKVPVPNVTQTTTVGPFDSSASSGAEPSLASGMSSSGSLENDSMNSAASLGSAASGSFGFYMAIWKWVLLSLLLLCCCIGIAIMSGRHSASKKKKAKKLEVDSARTVSSVSDPAKKEPKSDKDGKDDKGKDDKGKDKKDKKDKGDKALLKDKDTDSEYEDMPALMSSGRPPVTTSYLPEYSPMPSYPGYGMPPTTAVEYVMPMETALRPWYQAPMGWYQDYYGNGYQPGAVV